MFYHCRLTFALFLYIGEYREKFVLKLVHLQALFNTPFVPRVFMNIDRLKSDCNLFYVPLAEHLGFFISHSAQNWNCSHYYRILLS